MPSFVIHSICGRELEKKMNVSEEDKTLFFIGNLLPDTKQSVREFIDSSDIKRISNEKILTHFKTNHKPILEYPDLDYFLSKYRDEVKTNPLVFGYFFHLYADYYYFKYFLSDKLAFLDANYEVTDSKNYSYVKSIKNGKIMPIVDFWDRKRECGIYYEYSRMNQYLIHKYHFTYDVGQYIEYIDSNDILIPIKEVKTDRIKDLLRDVDYFYHENITDAKFQIFELSDVDTLIREILDTFMERYGELYYNYIR
ncbi:MAG: hypothetical protein IJ193_05435 [Bacilli bacterium]|nr:hypothetical protein [Bacilli bacterium]